MDGQTLGIILLLLGLALGALGGWFAGSRPAAELRDRLSTEEARIRELDDKFKAAIRELAGASERATRADELGLALEESRAAHGATTTELATLREKSANFDEQKRLLIEAQEALRKEFENVGNKVLAGAQEVFLARANERFEVSERQSAERLKTLLAPVDQRLKSYEEQVGKLEQNRVDAFGKLTSQIEGMRLGQEQVRTEAARLGNSLRNAPKVRGRWGEEQLKNVLEQCGLSEHTDFLTEHSVESEDGCLRPDAVVKIPGNKQLIIDSKVSLNYYQDSFESVDEISAQNALSAHASAMRNHVQQLSAKSYHSQFENAPDYVVMFVPGEHFITAALDQDPKLWDYAFDRRVLIASPTNLVAIARTISQVWQQAGLEKEAREIGKLASDLYDSLAKTQDDLSKVGVYLGRAVNSFNDFARTYDGNVLSRARRLTEKHIKIGKREVSDEMPFVEAAPRYGEVGTLAIESFGEDAES